MPGKSRTNSANSTALKRRIDQTSSSASDAKFISNDDETDNETNGIRIKRVTIKPDAIEKPVKTKNGNTSVPSTSFLIQSATLHDLCDSSFVRKNKLVRNKRKSQEPNSIVIGNSKAGGNNNDKTGSSNNIFNKPPPPPPPSTVANVSGGSNDVPKVGPQVEFINGKIMIRESSLVVNYDNAPNIQEYEEVTEGIYPTATYASFLNRRPTPIWSMEETKLFYSCLQRCGTEFSVMQTFFPNRTRKQLKRKFYKEEREHPLLVQKALYTSLPLPVDVFEAKYKVESDQNNAIKNESDEVLTTIEKNNHETGSISTSIISANVNKDENKTNIKRNEGKTNTAMLQYEIDSDGWIDL